MKQCYIVITHYRKPEIDNSGKQTQNHEITEQVEFIDNLRSRHDTDATIIINYNFECIIKNRTNQADYQSIMEYLNEKYPKKIARLREIMEG